MWLIFVLLLALEGCFDGSLLLAFPAGFEVLGVPGQSLEWQGVGEWCDEHVDDIFCGDILVCLLDGICTRLPSERRVQQNIFCSCSTSRSAHTGGNLEMHTTCHDTHIECETHDAQRHVDQEELCNKW